MPRLLRFRALLVLALLALAGCGDSASGPTPVEPVDSPVVPVDPDRHLTDAELVTPEDPSAPAERADWVGWIERSHHPIRSLTSSDNADLHFLAPVLAGKRVVQLGESSHGVKEFNQAKVRLIRYLHQEQGFDVIAFESGLFECWRASGRAGEADPVETMEHCLFGVWHTAEVVELFEYIRETRNTARPLILAGIDTQISSAAGTAGSPELLRQVIGAVDAGYGDRVMQLERDWQSEFAELRAGTPAGAGWEPLRRHLPALDSLIAFVDANLPALAAANGGSPEAPLVMRQMAFSRRQYTEQWSRTDNVQRHMARELGMADNLDALLDGIYPGKKVMVWAHNYHIQHDRAGLITQGPPQDLGDFNTMGHFVNQRRGAELYTIGLFMYRGSAAHNDREVYQVAPALSGSMESLGYRVRKKHFFFDLAGASGSGSDWARTTVTAKDSGIWDMGQVPAEQYDGIVFIDTVSPPDYL